MRPRLVFTMAFQRLPSLGREHGWSGNQVGNSVTNETPNPWPELAVRVIGDSVHYRVRRAKARFSSGCKSRPATFVPAGSNRSSCGGNETAEASGVEGHESDLVSM